MGIESTGDVERDVRVYRGRVALAVLGIDAMLETIENRSVTFTKPVVEDLVRIKDILNGDVPGLETT